MHLSSASADLPERYAFKRLCFGRAVFVYMQQNFAEQRCATAHVRRLPRRGEPDAHLNNAQASRARRSRVSDAPQFSKCNGDDRSQRLKQGGAVGAAASKTRAPLKVRSGCWVPQPGGTFPAALLRQSRFCLYAAKPLLNRGARHPADSGTAAAVLKVSAIAPDRSRHIFHSCAILMWKMKARKHHEIWHH